MRQIISYDDITTAPQPPPFPSKSQTNPTSAQPAAKKRKTTPSQRQGDPKPQQHWDDPGNQAAPMIYDDMPTTASSVMIGAESSVDAAGGDENYYEEGEEEEESRELTHEEIWDDSALIDAWNSAAAEYAAYHGPDKSWKNEKVKKSPLWYNVPPAITSKSGSKQKAVAKDASVVASNGINIPDAIPESGADSMPLNFDTFVPSHDPSLADGPLLAVPTMDGLSGLGTGGEMAMVSQDEAFSRAMTAMYWSGYWTAIYHSRRNELVQQSGAQVNESGSQRAEDVEEDEDEEMLPAQR